MIFMTSTVNFSKSTDFVSEINYEQKMREQFYQKELKTFFENKISAFKF